MAKSTHAQAVDDIQNALRPSLKERGFMVRGRTFNRTTEGGLTQVVNIQMGASDPPGTSHIPGFRLAERGLKDRARELLAEQVLETRNPFRRPLRRQDVGCAATEPPRKRKKP